MPLNLLTSSGISNTGTLTTNGDVTYNGDQSLNTNMNGKANLSGCTFTGPVLGLTKSTVGLGNVENTTDLNKVVSTATLTALNTKANLTGANTLTGLLNANGGIKVNNFSIPLFNNGTATTASPLVIPILFTSSTYNVVEIRVSFSVSVACDVQLSGNTGSTGGGTSIAATERCETITVNSATTFATNANVVANAAFGGINHQVKISITKASGSAAPADRNLYLFDSSYSKSGVGGTRINGHGYLGTSTLASLVLTPSAGTITASWYTTHY
jgi:hypothetical protein